MTVTARTITLSPFLAFDASPEMRRAHEAALMALIEADPLLQLDGPPAEPIAVVTPAESPPTRKLGPSRHARPPVEVPPELDSGQGWTPARIRGIRARLDMERDWFARQVGVSLQTIYNWEGGKTNVNPRYFPLLEELEKESMRCV